MSEIKSAKKSWYVVRVFTGHEKLVKDYLMEEADRVKLKDQIDEILIPTETIVEMKDGKKKEKSKVFFPGYIIVHAVLDAAVKHLISNTPSVIGFAGNFRNPQPLVKSEVDRIMGRVAEKREIVTYELPFQNEDKVKIIDGPFKDFVGTIKNINEDKRKLKVLVSIFGRVTPIEVDFLAVTTNITS